MSDRILCCINFIFYRRSTLNFQKIQFSTLWFSKYSSSSLFFSVDYPNIKTDNVFLEQKCKPIFSIQNIIMCFFSVWRLLPIKMFPAEGLNELIYMWWKDYRTVNRRAIDKYTITNLNTCAGELPRSGSCHFKYLCILLLAKGAGLRNQTLEEITVEWSATLYNGPHSFPSSLKRVLSTKYIE